MSNTPSTTKVLKGLPALQSSQIDSVAMARDSTPSVATVSPFARFNECIRRCVGPTPTDPMR